MRDDRLLAVCEREFTSFVESLFAAAHALPNAGNFLKTPLLDLPFIDGSYFVGFEESELRQRVCDALLAREHFCQDVPWAPLLPLRLEECEVLVDDDSARISLVGRYAKSMMYEYWDRRHPAFGSYCSGVLASGHAPEHLRNEPRLVREFPPHKLEGLGDDLYWYSPQTLARQRLNHAWCVAAGFVD